jgi:hypothetical protein
MNPSFVRAIFLSASGALTAVTSLAAEPPLAILARGPHHRVIQSESGGSYTELANGLCYTNAVGEWLDSEELFEIVDGTAVARRGQHKVTLAANINSERVVELTTLDGSRFVSRLAGLSYFDAATGDNILIAQVQDSIGVVHPPNQVIYPAALAGQGFTADVRYTWRKGSFEQDVIIREAPPSPAAFGLDPETTRLQVWTHFVDAPEPQAETTVLSAETDALARQVMAEPDFTDQTLDFGSASMSRGKAFAIGEQAEASKSMLVGKEWGASAKGDTFLIESVEFQSAEPILKTLPPNTAGFGNSKNGAVASRKLKRADLMSALAKLSVQNAFPRQQAVQVANRSDTRKGFLIDYEVLPTYGYANYTFAADKTYYIDGQINLSGTATLEGGAVIKFPPYNYYYPKEIRILYSGSRLNCATDQYRPAIFTARDDNTVGETISGSTGAPSGYYGNSALYFDYSSTAVLSTLSNVRIRYAKVGIRYQNGTGHTLTHAQLINCETAISFFGAQAHARNVLAANNANYTSGKLAEGDSTSILRGENLTLHDIRLRPPGSYYPIYDPVMYFTNSLLVAVNTSGNYSGIYNQVLSSAVGVFQTVGSGSRYLASDSYRNSGTLEINPSLLADLRKRTTYAPQELTADFTTPTVLLPRGIADTGPIDKGYHYDLIDFAWSGRDLSSTLLLTNGVAVAHYGSRGTTLAAGAKFVSEGSPLARNVLVPYTAVQENAVNWGTVGASFAILGTSGAQSSPAPEVYLRFTDISFPANLPAKRQLIEHANGHLIQSLTLRDSQFSAAHLIVSNSVAGAFDLTAGFTNNLFRRVTFTLRRDAYTPLVSHVYNNLFLNSTLQLLRNVTTGTTWEIHDNLFDSVSLTQGSASLANTHNGYLSTTALPGGTANKMLTIRNYQTGALGTNYYPTTPLANGLNDLINAGSRLASAAGLSPYTTTGATRDEGTVDIGLHYSYVGAPFVNAGRDQQILLGSSAILNGEVTSGSKGKIVIFHDEWVFDGKSFGVADYESYRSTHSSNLVVNLARWFVPQGAGNFLGSAAHVGQGFAEVLTYNGHTWHADSTPSIDLEEMLAYDAVFLCDDLSTDAATRAYRGQTWGPILADYVNSDGNVFILGGVSSDDYSAVLWNPFLSRFGLGFSGEENDISDIYLDVNSSHPLIWNVQRLYHDKGSSVVRTSSTDPNTEIPLQSGSEGLLATFAERNSLEGIQWTKISGPGTVTFSAVNSANTSATFSQGGTYVLRLSSSSAGLVGYDEITIYVDQAPSVTAIGPSTLDISQVASLSGIVVDGDNLPAGAAVTIDWHVVTTPPFGSVRLEPDPLHLTDRKYARATFSKPGEYRLRLSASDSLLSGHADLVIQVTKQNTAPTVNAGPDQNLEFGDRAYLPGTAVDDGLPGPMSITWTKVSGPGTVTFDDDQAAVTFASFSEPGMYVLSLSANDHGLPEVSNEVTITVTAPYVRSFRSVDYVSAGVSGLRNVGEGTIALSGISGTVRKAYVYWHGPTAVSDPHANASILVNGRLVVGTNTGTSHHNGWGFPQYNTWTAGEHSYTNSMAYRADITRLVSEFGNGAYTLSRLVKSQEVNVNGASIVVLFNDATSANDRDIILVDRHDSNGKFDFVVDPGGEALDVTLDGDKVLVEDFLVRGTDCKRWLGRPQPALAIRLTSG